jgi:hypothetical protein
MTPSFRLLLIGPAKSGKTSLLKSLAEHFGDWQKPLLTARLQTDLYFFSIREAYYAQRNFSLLSQKNLMLDGILLCCDLSQPLDDATLASLRFATKIGLKLRAIIGTHCDLFAGDDALADEYELSLRQQLTDAEISNEMIPLIRSDKSEGSSQECINVLHQIDWGVPNANKPALIQWMLDPKQIFAHVQQGTLSLQDEVEIVLEVNQRKKSKLLSASRDGISLERLVSPSIASIELEGFAPIGTTLVTSPGALQVSSRARAQIYLSAVARALMIANPSGERFILLYGTFKESAEVHIMMPKGLFTSEDSCTAEIWVAPGSKLYLYPGMNFSWRCREHQGGGVVTEI